MEKLKFTLSEQVIETGEGSPRQALTNSQYMIIILPIIIYMIIISNFQGQYIFISLPICLVISFFIYQRFRTQTDTETSYDPQAKTRKRRVIPAEELVFEGSGVYHIIYSLPAVEKYFPWDKMDEIVIGGYFERANGIYLDDQKLDLKKFIIQIEPYINKEEDVIEFLKKNSPLQKTIETRYSSGEPYSVYHFSSR